MHQLTLVLTFTRKTIRQTETANLAQISQTLQLVEAQVAKAENGLGPDRFFEELVALFAIHSHYSLFDLFLYFSSFRFLFKRFHIWA